MYLNVDKNLPSEHLLRCRRGREIATDYQYSFAIIRNNRLSVIFF
jgi:hypothetical protein